MPLKVEIGKGMAVATLTGEQNSDEIFMGDNGPEYKSNNSGGILGASLQVKILSLGSP